MTTTSIQKHQTSPSGVPQHILNALELTILTLLTIYGIYRLSFFSHGIATITFGLQSLNQYWNFLIMSFLREQTLMAMIQTLFASALTNSSLSLLSILNIISLIPAYLLSVRIPPRNTLALHPTPTEPQQHQSEKTQTDTNTSRNQQSGPIIITQPLTVPTVGILLWPLLLLSLVAALDPYQAYLHTPTTTTSSNPHHLLSVLTKEESALFAFSMIPQTFSFILRLFLFVSFIISIITSQQIFFWLLFGTTPSFRPHPALRPNLPSDSSSQQQQKQQSSSITIPQDQMSESESEEENEYSNALQILSDRLQFSPNPIFFFIPSLLLISIIVIISLSGLVNPIYSTPLSDAASTPFWLRLYQLSEMKSLPNNSTSSIPPSTLSLPCILSTTIHILTYVISFSSSIYFFFPFYLFDPVIRYLGRPDAGDRSASSPLTPSQASSLPSLSNEMIEGSSDETSSSNSQPLTDITLLPHTSFAPLALSFSPSEAIIMAHLVAMTITVTLSDRVFNTIQSLLSYLIINTMAPEDSSLATQLTTLFKQLPFHSTLLSYLLDVPLTHLLSIKPTQPVEQTTILSILDNITPTYTRFFNLFFETEALDGVITNGLQANHNTIPFHILSRPYLFSTLFTSYTVINAHLFTSYIISFGLIAVLFYFVLRLKPTINRPHSVYQTSTSQLPKDHPINPQQQPPTCGQLLGISIPLFVILTSFLPILYLLNPNMLFSILEFFAQHQREDPNTPLPAFPVFPFFVRVVLNPMKDLLYFIAPLIESYILPSALIRIMGGGGGGGGGGGDGSSGDSNYNDDSSIVELSTPVFITKLSMWVARQADFFNEYPHAFVLLYCAVISVIGIGFSLTLMPYTKSTKTKTQPTQSKNQSKNASRSKTRTRSNVVPHTPKSSPKQSPKAVNIDSSSSNPVDLQPSSLTSRPSTSFSIPLIVVRKYYHLMIFLVSAIPAFVDLPCLSLAFMCCLMLLLTCEILRCFQIDIWIPLLWRWRNLSSSQKGQNAFWYRIPVGSFCYRFFQSFSDERDNGPIILTHLYLLLGCAIPLWLVTTLTSTVYHQQQFLIQYQSQQYFDRLSPILPHLSQLLPHGVQSTNPIISATSSTESYSSLILSPLMDLLTSTSPSYCLPWVQSDPMWRFTPSEDEELTIITTSVIDDIQDDQNDSSSLQENGEQDITSCRFALPLYTQITLSYQQSTTKSHLTANGQVNIQPISSSLPITQISSIQIDQLSQQIQSFIHNMTRATWTPFPVHAHTYEFSPKLLDTLPLMNTSTQPDNTKVIQKDDNNDSKKKNENHPSSQYTRHYDHLWVIATSGIVALGLGDTFATVIGKIFSKLNALLLPSIMFKWPQSNKTYAGTLGFCLSMLSAFFTMGAVYQAYNNYYLSRSSHLDWNILDYTPNIPFTSSVSHSIGNGGCNFITLALSIALVGMIEAVTTQIDNVVLPLISIITLSLFTNCLFPL